MRLDLQAETWVSYGISMCFLCFGVGRRDSVVVHLTPILVSLLCVVLYVSFHSCQDFRSKIWKLMVRFGLTTAFSIGLYRLLLGENWVLRRRGYIKLFCIQGDLADRGLVCI